MLRRSRTLLAALLVTLGLLTLLPATGQARQSATDCRNVSVPVQVGLQHGAIAGTLCVPPNARTVQVLVPGWTYGRSYYTFPYQPETYSYVRAANRAGYATLAIDRLGSGASLHPLSAFDTFNADVRTVHDVIQNVRSGGTGQRFDKVVGVGHSLGSLVAASEAGQYHDVDTLVTTGFTHALNFTNSASKVVAPGVDYPAVADPAFARSNLDIGYMTSEPGTRGNFYNLAQTDPRVVGIDEAHKQTQSILELSDANTYNLINADHSLNVPVLAVTGSKDPHFCGLMTSRCRSSADLANYERRWYGPRAQVNGYLVPNGGHGVQLEEEAPTVNAHILDHLDRTVGRGSGTVGSAPGVQPQQPRPTPATPNPAAQALGVTFTAALKPVLAQLAAATNVVPGIGTQQQDLGHVGDLLHIIGNLNYRVLGNLPARVLSTL